ncbi:hypothetical protein BdWA1_001477 [Babesia duncani]|uniref:Uncharacterized protein n=1 Tax=Babesia duncani TaxID=323732 RepID=A0AAD9UR03_9APIC|nr:hypothetical protein BdWA1_001477 [Babesia duncani]
MHFSAVLRTYTTTRPPKAQIAQLPARPPGRRPIGYRGNLQHGKPLYDIVYPTVKVPAALVPRFPLDWRNAGRFILTAAMAKIENCRLLRHSQSLAYQRQSHCGPKCAHICSKDPYRCLCAWRMTPQWEHINNVDNILMSYKGPIPTNKPLFTVPYPIAKKNTQKSNKLHDFKIIKETFKYPVFNSRQDYIDLSNSNGPTWTESDAKIFKL